MADFIVAVLGWMTVAGALFTFVHTVALQLFKDQPAWLVSAQNVAVVILLWPLAIALLAGEALGQAIDDALDDPPEARDD